MEEVTRTSREQIDVLVEDRRVAREESDARVQNIEQKIEEVSKKHDRIQELLQQTTQVISTEFNISCVSASDVAKGCVQNTCKDALISMRN